MTEFLKKAGFEIMNEGIKQMWTPDQEMKKQCIEFGKQILGAS